MTLPAVTFLFAIVSCFVLSLCIISFFTATSLGQKLARWFRIDETEPFDD